MNFYIPLNKVKTLEQLLNRAIKKGGAISYTKGEECIRDGVLHIRDPKTGIEHTQPIKVRCLEIEVSGSYKINGWEFVGVVEFTPAGNIIRLANSDFEGKVPERYNHTAPVCEHCKTTRSRKDCYLIYNSSTNEWKQVGRNCLFEYTNGLDAEICAGIMSNLDKFTILQNGEYSWDEFYGNGFNATYAGVSTLLVKKFATALIKKFGYNKTDSSHPTRDDLVNLLFSRESDDRLKGIEPDDSLISQIDQYLEYCTETYGYMYNAKVAWMNEYCEVRDFGLIASLISVYLREVEKEQQQKADAKVSQYVGNVGDRIQFEIADARVISFNYQFDTYFYVIKDTEGNTYLWSTGTELNAGDVIKATVRAHEEYKGLKQTVITRGRIQ